MRIIRGSRKGRSISIPKGFTSRPTTDFAKEALFNILENSFYFEKLSVLDLFSGTGSISLEFLSRGCKLVTSVEIKKTNCIHIEKQIENYFPNMSDVIIADEVWSESTYAKTQSGYDKDVICASVDIVEKLNQIAEQINIPIKRGRIHSSDVFYRQDFNEFQKIRDSHNCIAVEMEAFALFATAKLLNKKAACLLTVSDSLVSGGSTTSEQRQKSFTRMMEIALRLPSKM